MRVVNLGKIKYYLLNLDVSVVKFYNFFLWGFLWMICFLRKFGIKYVCVFDCDIRFLSRKFFLSC